MIIHDGKGSGNKLRVNANNRIHTQAVTENEHVNRVSAGNAYHINSGNITFSAAGTVLYLKNNEDADIEVESMEFSTGAGTLTSRAEITIENSPTGGDLISDATAVSVNGNKNFGSNKTLTADVYKGKSGGTSTGGTDALYFYISAAENLRETVNLIIPKGSSLAVTFNPDLASGSMKATCALVVHIKDVASAD